MGTTREDLNILASIELRDLRVFLVACEELHFGRTANRLQLTPARVSQTVAKLETLLGGVLFDRNSRRVALTPAGIDLRARLSPLLTDVDVALNEARATMRDMRGVLRLGLFSPVSGGPHLQRIIESFQTEHPECRVQTVSTFSGPAQYSWLRDRQADILAVRLPFSGHAVRIGPVLSCEPRVVALPAGDPLAEREEIAYDDLAGRRLAYPAAVDPELAATFFPLDTPSGGRLEPIASADPPETMLRVRLGELIHLTVPSFMEQHPQPGVVAVPVSDLPPSKTALAWLEDHEGPMHRAFACAAKAALR